MTMTPIFNFSKLILVLFISMLFLAINTLYAIELKPSEALALKTINAKYMAYKSIKSKFTQIDNKGNKLLGWFAIDRPKRARIEYETIKIRFIANANSLLFDDLNQNQKTILPLNASIFSYLLEENNSLIKEDIEILSFKENQDDIELKLTNKENPQIGSLTLQLNKYTGHIIKWIVLDAIGTTTTVILNNPSYSNAPISPSNMFNIQRVSNINFNDITQN